MPSEDVLLKRYNTFGVAAEAEKIIVADSLDQIIQAYRESQARGVPFLILGEGSNVLFTENFTGIVLVNRVKGKQIVESAHAWHLHVGAGENWHKFVEWTLDNKMAGLENLALIPGSVGAAPNQNIGAYGVELKNVCEYVDLLNLKDGTIRRMSNEQCEFGYRDSIFKRNYSIGYVIVAVGFVLSKQWRPVLTYADLAGLKAETLTPRQIYDAVCSIRRRKLPHPNMLGNAGSFFKSVIVCEKIANEMLEKYPQMPQYRNSHDNAKVRIASGWLIEQCQLKGFRIGNAAVHERHALVLVNLGNALSSDIVALAKHVRHKVAFEFGVWLEPEVQFIGSNGYVNWKELLV